MSNLEFERDVIIYTDSDINIKTELAEPIQVLEASSTTTFKHECPHCEYKTNKKSNHDAHVKMVHQRERHSCPECGKEIANLNQHLRVIHKIFKASSREKVCDICNKKFHNLEAHKKKAHNIQSTTDFVCNICFKVFTKKDHLVRHESVVHFGARPRQPCMYCNKQFANLEKHVQSQHMSGMADTSNFCNTAMVKETVKVLYPCNLCNKVFNKKAVLNQHRFDIHGIEDPNKKLKPCPHCHKSFTNLAQHIEIVHNESKKYSCQKCGKRFYDNRELRRHHIKFLTTGECKKQTSGTFKFACEFEGCDYQSNKKCNMEMHQQSVHLKKKFPCPVCNKNLSSKANLNSHVKNVHGKRLVGGVLEMNSSASGFRCKLCDYTTNRALHLDRHMLSVHSEAAFETVEQVYQASTQAREMKPALASLIKTQQPRSNAKLPQFANLVRLETSSGNIHEESEMILGGDEILHRDAETEKIESDLFEDYQEEMTFVTATGPEQNSSVLIRRISSDSVISGVHEEDVCNVTDSGDQQIVTQTSTFQVDANGKLIIPEYATLVQLTPGVNGLVLPTIPLDLNTISSVNPIYLSLNN